MNVQKLHELTGKLIAEGKGDSEVAINYATFIEPQEDNNCILPIESAHHRKVQGADDSGPVGGKFPFLILEGTP